MSIICLKDLCDLGIHILNGQLNHLIFYGTYDVESGPILEDLRIFYKWAKATMRNDLLPLIDCLKKKKADDNGKDLMPILL